MIFGEKVKTARENANISKAKVLERLGISWSTLTKLENMKSSNECTNIELIYEYAEMLNVNLNYFLANHSDNLTVFQPLDIYTIMALRDLMGVYNKDVSELAKYLSIDKSTVYAISNGRHRTSKDKKLKINDMLKDLRRVGYFHSARLKHFRKEHNLTVDDLSKLTGIHSSTISAVERHEREISDNFAVKLRDITDKRFNYWVSNTTEWESVELVVDKDDIDKQLDEVESVSITDYTNESKPEVYDANRVINEPLITDTSTLEGDIKFCLKRHGFASRMFEGEVNEILALLCKLENKKKSLHEALF